MKPTASLPLEVRDAMAAYARQLAARFGSRLRFVLLFGSWARGEAREDSDVDVAAVVDGVTRKERRGAVGGAPEGGIPAPSSGLATLVPWDAFCVLPPHPGTTPGAQS